MTNRPLIFVGARADFSLFVHVAELLGISVLGILDQYYYGNTDNIQGIPIIGSELQLDDPTDSQAEHWRTSCDFIVTSAWNGRQYLQPVGLDNELLRIQRCDLVDRVGVNVINLIDPTSQLTPCKNIKFGRGILIAKYSGLNSDIEIGDHSQFDSYVAFGHDVKIGRNVTTGAQCIFSTTVVEDNVRFGVQCNVLGNDPLGKPITIGRGSTIWNGVSIYRDVPPDSVVAPAMPKVLAKQRKL